MIYVYNCFGGTHSSTIAAAIHLGKLPADRVPEKEEILGTDYFNKLDKNDMGKIIYRGTDNDGGKIYTIGRGSSKILIPCLENMIQLLHGECGIDEKIVFSNTSPTVPLSMTIGGFLSRGLGIDFLGVPLLVAGARKAYFTIVELVDSTRRQAKSMNGPVLVIENEDFSKRIF